MRDDLPIRKDTLMIWNGTTRRTGVNARLFDNFDPALAAVVAIDGKHLW